MESSMPRQSTQTAVPTKIKFLVASRGEDHKLSRIVDVQLEDITQSGVRFQTNSMTVDGLHLAYDESPLLKNRLIIELELPNLDRKIKALGEVVWYEKSSSRQEEFFHVEAEFKEMSDEDEEVLKDYLMRLKK